MTIVTFSRMVGYSLEAAKALEKEGISVEVINLRWVRIITWRGVMSVVVRLTNSIGPNFPNLSTTYTGRCGPSTPRRCWTRCARRAASSL